MITIFNIEYTTITSGADYHTVIFNVLDTKGNEVVKYESINNKEIIGDLASRVGQSLAEHLKNQGEENLPYGKDYKQYEVSFTPNMPMDYCLKLEKAFNKFLKD